MADCLAKQIGVTLISGNTDQTSVLMEPVVNSPLPERDQTRGGISIGGLEGGFGYTQTDTNACPDASQEAASGPKWSLLAAGGVAGLYNPSKLWAGGRAQVYLKSYSELPNLIVFGGAQVAWSYGHSETSDGGDGPFSGVFDADRYTKLYDRRPELVLGAHIAKEGPVKFSPYAIIYPGPNQADDRIDFALAIYLVI